METTHTPTASWFSQHPVLQIAVYYLALGAAVAVLSQVNPGLQGVFTMERFSEAVSTGRGGLQGSEMIPAPIGVGTMAAESVFAMLGAVLLMIPVAWVYILTRAKRGFSQSTVQTLIFLPIVVAGLIMLVRASVALAFGLGGVVGAVSFRNRLEDPKDAIYIFLSIAVGLASGVQVLAVALTISLFYNVVVLLTWWVDFGRMPAQLEAGIASRRLARAKAGGRDDFMKVVDQHLLNSMTPEQLRALSERAAQRSRKAAEEASDEEEEKDEKEEKKESVSAVRISMEEEDVAVVRPAIEKVLAEQTKRWEFERVGSAGGFASAHYKVKFKRSQPRAEVIEAMRRSVLPRIVTIDVRDA